MAKSSKKRANMRKPKKSSDPSASALVYRGPLVTPLERLEAKLQTYVVGYSGTVSSTAGGVNAAVYANGTSNLANIANWTDLSGTFAEYRVLKWEVHYFPYNRYSKVTTTCAPGIKCVDRENSTALTSIGDGMIHESSTVMSLEDPWVIKVNMSGSDEAQFLATSSGNPTSWIKLYASGLTVSTTFGQIYLFYRIQFRGHTS